MIGVPTFQFILRQYNRGRPRNLADSSTQRIYRDGSDGTCEPVFNCDVTLDPLRLVFLTQQEINVTKFYGGITLFTVFPKIIFLLCDHFYWLD